MSHAHRALDPRIGALATGRFYAFVNGYDKPHFEGTLHQVEQALGLRRQEGSAAARAYRDWDVRLSFEYPAWDEREGIWYRGISARTKAEANRAARHQAHGDGHLAGGKGRVTFTAFEAT